MPEQGGIFKRLYSWVADAGAGKPISAVEMDADANDIAGALSIAMYRDGSSIATNDIPMGGHDITGIRQAAQPGDAVEYAQWQASLATRIPGEIIDYAGTTAPAKWLMCDGRAVSRTTYALLFAAIGTTFGAGDGSTTFALPDARGRATFGGDAMSGTAATSSTAAGRLTAAVSGITGTTLGAAGGDQNPQAHTHVLSSSSVPVFQTNPFGGSSTGSGGTNIATVNLNSITSASSGAGASGNVPPALVLAKMIYAGV